MDYRIEVMGLSIKIKCQYALLRSRIEKYIQKEPSKMDFEITYEDDKLAFEASRFPNARLEEVEYMITSYLFYRKIVDYDAMLIHSSAVCYENKAYCFSANSGVGKSTHSQMYLNYLPGSYYINDDKPAYRIIDDKIYVYGTPWSGKNDLSNNVGIPLQGLCFIKRANENKIVRLSDKEAIHNILKQTIIINHEGFLNKMLTLLDKVITLYPIYELCCTMEKEAFLTSYEKLKGNKNEN